MKFTSLLLSLATVVAASSPVVPKVFMGISKILEGKDLRNLSGETVSEIFHTLREDMGEIFMTSAKTRSKLEKSLRKLHFLVEIAEGDKDEKLDELMKKEYGEDEDGKVSEANQKKFAKELEEILKSPTPFIDKQIAKLQSLVDSLDFTGKTFDEVKDFPGYLLKRWLIQNPSGLDGKLSYENKVLTPSCKYFAVRGEGVLSTVHTAQYFGSMFRENPFETTGEERKYSLLKKNYFMGNAEAQEKQFAEFFKEIEKSSSSSLTFCVGITAACLAFSLFF